MKETIIHCDICGRAHTVPGKIYLRNFNGDLKKVCIGEVRPNSDMCFVSYAERLDICQPCARKIEKFFEDMEKE